MAQFSPMMNCIFGHPHNFFLYAGYAGSELAGPGEGQFVEVDLEMQSFNKECSEESSYDSSGDDVPSRRGSGSGFVNSSDEEACGNLQKRYPAEMYLPGQVLHILRKEKPAVSWSSSFWNTWKAETKSKYSAVVVDRKEFRDLVISPSMFIDHMPWK
jgi:hypothetical protein